MGAVSILMTISSICGAVITIVGFITLLVKQPAKRIKQITETYTNSLIDEKLKEIKEMIMNLSKKAEADKDATLAALRHSITSIYQKYLPEKCLPAKVKSDLCSLYDAYEKLNGNSYIHEIYEDMMKWDTK